MNTDSTVRRLMLRIEREYLQLDVPRFSLMYHCFAVSCSGFAALEDTGVARALPENLSSG